jgi:hypothetical protein
LITDDSPLHSRKIVRDQGRQRAGRYRAGR